MNDDPDNTEGIHTEGIHTEGANPVAESPTLGVRETYRRQMLDSIGGWSGSLITAIPPVVFVIVNSVSSLRVAVISAIGSAAALALYRLARHQSLQQAATGLVGVVVAAVIAARTGHAKDYFLVGIWSSFVYAGVFLASILVRRPIIGLLWEFLDPAPGPEIPAWYRRAPLLRGYTYATLIGTALFASRAIVQFTLFRRNATGWLAFARIAMGFPLYLAAVAAGFWVVTRARRRYQEGLTERA
ncbi:MAG: DUF3159 domain-containing protein [Actinomycetota bacterium]|nr:DUF3159 domain-containing protein [Actinomycetota bacterium]